LSKKFCTNIKQNFILQNKSLRKVITGHSQENIPIFIISKQEKKSVIAISIDFRWKEYIHSSKTHEDRITKADYS